MPIVTFKVADVAGDAISLGAAPEVIFTPSETAVTSSGVVVTSFPLVFRPDAAGNVRAELISSDEVASRSFHYKLSIRWLDVDAYGGAGYTSIDFGSWEIRVPAGGGNLGDFSGLPPVSEAFWVGVSPPPAGSDFRWWVDTSGSEPVLKEWRA